MTPFLQTAAAFGLAAFGCAAVEVYVRELGRRVTDRAFRKRWSPEARESRWLVVRALWGGALLLAALAWTVSAVL